MAKQAKTLNATELRRVLDYVSTRPHAARNRAMVMTTFLGGMRVGEVSALRCADVIDEHGKVRSEILLRAEQTKGSEGRVVFISDKLKKELQGYANTIFPAKPDAKLFYSQKRGNDGFSSNTLCQFFHHLYKRAGIIGASSHSGRRTYATTIASRGVGIRVLQKLLGHKNLQTTSVYIDANDDMLRKAVDLI